VRRRCGIVSKRAGKASSQQEAAKGKPTAGSALAVKQFEELEELMGRIVAYAGLVYAGDTSDPQRAKLYGDIQEKMTDAIAHLLFFTLELNQSTTP
jgi:oligoendopeptidase F